MNLPEERIVFADRLSWNHSALEHLVSDGRRDLVDEYSAHLWIALQKSDYFLFFSAGWRFSAFLLPQLLAAGLLVILDYLTRDLV